MRICLSVVLAVFELPVMVWADLPITQIAATGDPAPDGGTFTSFGMPTTDRQTNQYTGLEPFWFQATTSNGVSGVYVYDGIYKDYATLADTTMTVPQGGTTFTSFFNVSSGSGEVGFIATDTSGTQGVYAIGAFPLALVATTNTSPSPGVSFGQFQSISIMGGPDFGDEGFGYGYENGEIESTAGIYDFVGSYNPFSVPSNVPPPNFTLVANTSTTPPGASGPFTTFGPVSYKPYEASSNAVGIAGTYRAVRATAGGVEGIYFGTYDELGGHTLAPLVSLVNAGAAVPDSNGNPTAATFTSFGNPIVTTNEITFTANYSTSGSDQQGIFSYSPYQDETSSIPLEVRQLVAAGQTAPDSDGAIFTGFSDITDDSFDQIFLANLSDGGEGLYVRVDRLNLITHDYKIFKIVETGDLFDGKTIADISLSPDAVQYEDGDIDFGLDFNDGTQGLYYLNIYDAFIVPEPTSLSLLALPLVFLRRRRTGKSTIAKIFCAVEPLEQRRLLQGDRMQFCHNPALARWWRGR